MQRPRIEPDPDEAQRQHERVTELEIFLAGLESSLRHLARSRQGTELRRMATEIRTLLAMK
jgi:hypothetical protein